MSAADITTASGVLGIELGSTRIKLCLVAADDPATILGTGAHEWQNQYVDGVWTYPLDEVWSGLRSAYADWSRISDRPRRRSPASASRR